MLLRQLIRYLKSNDSSCQCKAIFLHVLSSNSDAIRFYESQSFSRHQFLPLYYFIDGKCLDGISYVRYMNGGRAPLTFSVACKSIMNLCTECTIPFVHAVRGLGQLLNFLNWKLSHIVKFPARLIHTMHQSFSKQSSAVKYHQVASA